MGTSHAGSDRAGDFIIRTGNLIIRAGHVIIRTGDFIIGNESFIIWTVTTEVSPDRRLKWVLGIKEQSRAGKSAGFEKQKYTF